MFPPVISIIIPVYNVEPYLRKCLDSCLAQTMEDIEVICIDNGSTDASPNILQEYTNRDRRVVVLSHPEGRQGDARNVGLDHALGKYVLFVDSDDWIDSDLCEKTWTVAEYTSSDAVFFRHCEYHPETQTETPDSQEYGYFLYDSPEKMDQLLACAELTVSDKLWRRDFLVRHSLRFPKGIMNEDTVFAWAAITRAETVATISDSFFYHYRRRQGSSTMQSGRNRLDIIKSIELIKSDLTQTGNDQRHKALFLRFKLLYCLYDLTRLRLDVPPQEVRHRIREALDHEDIEFIRSGKFLPKPAQKYFLDLLKHSDDCRFVSFEDVKKTFKKIERYVVLPWKNIVRFLSGKTDKETLRNLKTLELQESKIDAMNSRLLCLHRELQKDTTDSAIISIAIPVYNAEKYLEECLDSCVAQTLKEIQIICVDHGSTDGSRAIVEKFVKKDSRIQIVDCPNTGGGPGQARNAVFPYIRGKYVYFVDSDDRLDPTLCEKVFVRMEHGHYDLLLLDCRFIAEKGQEYRDTNSIQDGFPLAGDADDYLGYCCAPWSRVIRTEFLQKNNLRFLEGCLPEDCYFHWVQIVNNPRTAMLCEKLYDYRLLPNSQIGKRGEYIARSVSVFDSVRKYLIENGLYEKYETLYLQHKLEAAYNSWHTVKTEFKPLVRQLFCDSMTEKELAKVRESNEIFRSRKDFCLAMLGDRKAKLRNLRRVFVRGVCDILTYPAQLICRKNHPDLCDHIRAKQKKISELNDQVFDLMQKIMQTRSSDPSQNLSTNDESKAA